MLAHKTFGSRLEESFGALKERNFRYLTLGTLSLSFAQWFQQIGLGWLVYQITGSATQLGAITGVRGVVLLFMSPVAGILSDRMNRKTLLIISTAINAVPAVVLAVLMGTGHVQVWHLYAFSLLGGATMAISFPVRQAMLFDVVGRESVARAVPINSLAQNLARIVGPAIAGVIIGFAGTASVFYVLAALTLVAMGFTMLIGTTTQIKLDTKESPLRTLAEGFRYALSNRAILGQLVLAMIPTLLIYPYVQFLPFFAEKLHSGAKGYGVLATGVGWGSLVGLATLMLMGDVKHKGRVLLLSGGIYPLAVALFALSNNFVGAMAFLVLAGVCNSLNTTLQNTLLLLTAKEEMRGRVMALYSMAGAMQPIGTFTMGIAIAKWGASDGVVGYMLASVVLIAAAGAVFGSVRRA